jgi:hypothetical protein
MNAKQTVLDAYLAHAAAIHAKLERLADIEAGKVGIVVVYKIDRLTRGLGGTSPGWSKSSSGIGCRLFPSPSRSTPPRRCAGWCSMRCPPSRSLNGRSQASILYGHQPKTLSLS